MDVADDREWASPLALEVLDELIAVLDECEAVLFMLVDEATLNLDELAEVLAITRSEALSTFRAASLLNRDAALTESWAATGRSRPRAVFARHAEAVRAGAPRVKPATPSIRFLADKGQVSVAGDTHETANADRVERPRCAAFAKSKGRACSNPATCIGPNKYLRHCYGHFEPAERELFDAHRSSVVELSSTRRAVAIDAISENGRMVAADWIERRRLRTESLED